MMGPSRRPHYGIDGGIAGVSLLSAVLTSLAIITLALRRNHPRIARLVVLTLVGVAGVEVSYLYSTGPGKRSLWSDLLDELGLRGDERALDIGCGRGAVLMLLARRLPQGRSLGADIWRSQDQSGNSRSATQRNAVREGLSDRIELVDADARQLPIPSGSFDLVVSNLALHNIADSEGRTRALFEAVRVLRAGGRLLIADHGAALYAATLREAGCEAITCRKLDWRTWYGIPGHHFDLVTATKPKGLPGKPATSQAEGPPRSQLDRDQPA